MDHITRILLDFEARIRSIPIPPGKTPLQRVINRSKQEAISTGSPTVRPKHLLAGLYFGELNGKTRFMLSERFRGTTQRDDEDIRFLLGLPAEFIDTPISDIPPCSKVFDIFDIASLKTSRSWDIRNQPDALTSTSPLGDIYKSILEVLFQLPGETSIELAELRFENAFNSGEISNL